MAGWRDKLQRASFRGVWFSVVTAESGYGRRLASHEYPQRDDPWHEDMGRKFRSFSIDCFVLEPDHIEQAKNLIAALEKPGPGKLVHPWLGELDVVVTECKVRFSHAEGGMAVFAIAFAEAGRPVYPASEEDATGAINRSADEAKTAISTRFLKGFSVAKVAGWVGQQASALLGDAAESIAAALGIPGGAAEAAGWARDIAGVVNTAAAIVRDPAGLTRSILGSLDIGNAGSVASLVQVPLSIVASGQSIRGASDVFPLTWQQYLPLTRWGMPYIPDEETTATRRKNNENRRELGSFVRKAATIEMARAAVVQEFETTQDAQAASAAIQAAVDQEMPLAGDEDGAALQAVASTAQRVLAKKIAVLPTRIVVSADQAAAGISAATLPSLPLTIHPGPVPPRVFPYTPRATVPAIIIAYSLYGDTIAQVPSRAEQIVARNRIPHGGFVAGGTPIELISLG